MYAPYSLNIIKLVYFWFLDGTTRELNELNENIFWKNYHYIQLRYVYINFKFNLDTQKPEFWLNPLKCIVK